MVATASRRQLQNLCCREMKVQRRSILEKPSLPLLPDRTNQARVIGKRSLKDTLCVSADHRSPRG